MVTVGMDEVGRGSWAGPVVVGAVILDGPILGLRDSKLLTKKQREVVSSDIRAAALAWAIGQATSTEVDALGLTAALSLAYERALEGITLPYAEVIIDGTYNFLATSTVVRTLINADQSVPAVSAASIIAKVTRDQMMARMDTEYPGYGFARHMGYGTVVHATALRHLGPCPIHRRSVAPVRGALEVAP